VLHGYGARRERLGELVDSYAARHCGVLIFPLAPVDLSRDRLAWWRPRTRRPLRTWRPAEVVLPGVARAVQAVEGLLEEVRARFGVASNDVVVAGFSQGATLAAHVGMNAAAPLGAVVLLGGRFHTVERSGSCSAALAGTPVLIAHGDADRVAPFAGAQRLRRALEESGVDVEWVGFRGGHRPSPAVQRRFHGALAAELERPRHG
jgi:phospholipase/carboxylesterase